MKLNSRTKRINQLKRQVAKLEGILRTRSNEVTILAGPHTIRIDRSKLGAIVSDAPVITAREFNFSVVPNESPTIKVML